PQIWQPPAQHGHGPGVRCDQAYEAANQRGLAGAIGAKQSEHLSTPDPQLNPVQRAQPAEVLDHTIDLDRQGAFLPVPHCSTSRLFARIAWTQISARVVTASSTGISSPSSRAAMGRVIRWNRIGPTKACKASSGCMGRSLPAAI